LLDQEGRQSQLGLTPLIAVSSFTDASKEALVSNVVYIKRPFSAFRGRRKHPRLVVGELDFPSRTKVGAAPLKLVDHAVCTSAA
jgi:hypothetical protein